MKYDLLLADADGTLFDFLAGERNALRRCWSASSCPGPGNRGLYSGINESHWKRFERGETTQARLRVERFRDFLRPWAARDAAVLSEAYADLLGQQRILLPGALELAGPSAPPCPSS